MEFSKIPSFSFKVDKEPDLCEMNREVGLSEANLETEKIWEKAESDHD